VRNQSFALTLAGVAALLLAACGGGGGGGGGTPVNQAPIARAGSAQTVSIGQSVTLNGSASSDADGTVSSYAWTQTGGVTVTLTGATTAQPSFTVPTAASGTALTFSLVVTDNQGATSQASFVTITVSATSTGTISGTVRYARVPFRFNPTVQLNYGSPTMQPARGVVVRALDATSQIALATGVTSDTGTYSLTVPSNVSITIQVEARLLRDSAQPLPNWNVRVQNGINATAPYRYTTAAFNSSIGTQNIDLNTGIDSSGAATGARDSGPFAILDTIYTCIQTLLTVAPTVNLPTMYVDWGSPQNGAFFTTGNGQHIALDSDLTEDTDEFDAGVIAHEYSHYLQYNFSRGDSIGGKHAVGDKLDPRVAFDEGLATGIGGILRNDNLYIDSYVDASGTLKAGGFSLELNPSTGPTDSVGLGLGCWCNESTVWSLVWDLYDSTNSVQYDNGVDNVQLGLGPIWQALTGPQKTTPALGTLFSFLTALKVANPSSAAAIDTLVTAQNIDSTTIDAFASTETHQPISGVNLLPVFANIVVGTPVVLRTVDDAAGMSSGNHNKAGDHRFLKFVPTSSGSYTIKLTTSNANANSDPDFYVYRAGTTVVAATGQPSPSGETATLSGATAGTTYVIDAYDCANGCDPSGASTETPGDYDLTVTIN
jgi:hypothetical protein